MSQFGEIEEESKHLEEETVRNRDDQIKNKITNPEGEEIHNHEDIIILPTDLENELEKRSIGNVEEKHQNKLETNPKELKKNRCNRMIGIFLALLGSLCYLTYVCITKFTLSLYEDLHPFQMFLIEGYFFIAVSFPICVIKKPKMIGFTK